MRETTNPAIIDIESCQTCGEPNTAPECAACFDSRWHLDVTAPIASLDTRVASATDERR
jgi:hypothetical protein